MKRLLFVAVTILLVFTAGSAAWYVNKLQQTGKAVAHPAIMKNDNALKEKLNNIAIAAKRYAAGNKFNTGFCFLADMSIASGKQRFFVYDMKNDTVMAAGLVTHGRCNQDWLTGRKYGNTAGCGCSSLGKYKVGYAYRGKFGLAYKLYGMESTNSNAYSRFVVLHSHQCVPEAAVDPYPICQSDGCPTVSPGFLKELAALIDGSKQPVLLWIYQ